MSSLRSGGEVGGARGGSGKVGPLAVLAVGTVIVLACASSGGGGGEVGQDRQEDEGRQREVRITAVNDLTIKTPTRIRLVSEEGSRVVLGTVSPGDEETFVIRDRPVTGAYRLRAETGRGERFESRSFRVFDDAWIQWKMRSNTVSVGYRFETESPRDTAEPPPDSSRDLGTRARAPTGAGRP